MVLSELRERLLLKNVAVTEPQIRWAIRTGKVTRPRLDGSLRFEFTEDNLQEITRYFRRTRTVGVARKGGIADE